MSCERLFVKHEGDFAGYEAGEKGEIEWVYYLSESRLARLRLSRNERRETPSTPQDS